jgi:hypothetical protein
VTAAEVDVDTAARLWSEADRRSGPSPADRGVVDSTASIRMLIVEIALRQGPDEELYDACAVLGRLIADGGGSTSLAATCVDHACAALGDLTPPWAPGARAAMAEGFVRALVEGARKAGQASWDFPACAVRLDATTLAVAAGHPSDDEETLATWAGRAARAAACEGVRRAFVSGRDRPRAALVDAFAIVGIDCAEK